LFEQAHHASPADERKRNQRTAHRTSEWNRKLQAQLAHHSQRAVLTEAKKESSVSESGVTAAVRSGARPVLVPTQLLPARYHRVRRHVRDSAFTGDIGWEDRLDLQVTLARLPVT
jgi:hypothetical protein